MPLEISLDASTGLPLLTWGWAPGQTHDEAWQAWARALSAHWQACGVLVPDAVVLLPQIALLNVARQAWAQAVGGWIPRFETVGTLLDRLPQVPVQAHDATQALTLDACMDSLLLSARLRSEASGQQWARRDPGGFDFAVARMVELAQQWLKAALTHRPQTRQIMVAQAEVWMQQSLNAGAAGEDGDPRARERVLSVMALSWAMDAMPALAGRRDPVFEHHPSAWVAVTLGAAVVPGSESALMVSVLQQGLAAGLPVLWAQAVMVIQALPGAQNIGDLARPKLAVCLDGEDEARHTAAQVLARVAEHRHHAEAGSGLVGPVALIATDRVVTRRVRALLASAESAGNLVISDESGWTLSTTRAATVVTRTLGAAAPAASTDDVLDWLSSAWVSPPGGTAAVAELERHWRVLGRTAPCLGQDRAGQGMACDLQLWAEQTLQPMRAWAESRRGLLQGGLEALKAVLHASGAFSSLHNDAAGLSVLAALRLADEAAGSEDESGALWQHLASTTRLSWPQWVRWVDQTLEASTFLPPGSDAPADVVIVPLTRAVLRPFAAIVLPGADESVLGVRAGDGWLSPVDAQALGLPTPGLQQQAQWEAFAVLATHDRMLALQRQVRLP